MKLGFIGTGNISSDVVSGICKSKISFKRILVISDLHIPYHHQDSFDFLREIKKCSGNDKITSDTVLES